MTDEKAIKKIKSLCHGCVEFPHCVNTDPDCFKALEMAIKALEQGSILDKIRTEIETDLSHFCFDDWGNETTEWKEVKAIIDKYKTESEG